MKNETTEYLEAKWRVLIAPDKTIGSVDLDLRLEPLPSGDPAPDEILTEYLAAA